MAKLPSKIILGSPELLDLAGREWLRVKPGETVKTLPTPQNDSWKFDLKFLDDFDSSSVSAFAVWGDQFLNLRRHELYLALRERGFMTPPLVSPDATLAPSLEIHENAWINQAVHIGHDVKIGSNCYVGFGSSLQPGCQVGANVTIHENVVIGKNCKIGAFCAIGPNVTLAADLSIAPYSRLIKPGLYENSYANARFAEKNFEAYILS